MKDIEKFKSFVITSLEGHQEKKREEKKQHTPTLKKEKEKNESTS